MEDAQLSAILKDVSLIEGTVGIVRVAVMRIWLGISIAI